LGDINFRQLKHIFVPIQLPSHWVAVYINLQQKTIISFDPFNKPNNFFANKIIDFLKKKLQINNDKWKLSLGIKHCFNSPVFVDPCNSGVYLCYFANIVFQNQDFQPVDDNYLLNFRNLIKEKIFEEIN
jgi:Ulp1 family protease